MGNQLLCNSIQYNITNYYVDDETGDKIYYNSTWNFTFALKLITQT